MTNEHPYPAQKTMVIHTRGTDRAIGRQHAEQLGDAVTKGMVKFYYEFWRRLLDMRPAGRWERRLISTLKYCVDPLLLNRLRSRIPDFADERVRGLAEVAGVPYEQLATSLVLPDLLPLLQSYLTRLRPRGFVEAAAPPHFGCSSFVSSGKSFLHGRNLDFPGVSYWDRFPVIQLTQRDGYLSYISFTSAGVPLGGITGINEAQVSVSLHQHYCRVSSLKGDLPFGISEKILCQARSCEEALKILQGARVATSWAFVVTDGKSRRAFIYECHPKASGLRLLEKRGDVLAHSNFFQTRDCQRAEYATTSRMNWDNYWRKTRLEALVKAAGDELNLSTAALFLSDHFDPYWGEEKTINRTVSQVYNIQSLVLDPEKMKVAFAEGDCPIQTRGYREFDLAEIFARREGRTEVIHPSYVFQDPKKKAAKEAYILSFVAAFDGNFKLALDRLKESLSHQYVAEAGYVAAMLCLKLGDYAPALEFLSQAKNYIEDKKKAMGRSRFPPEYFEIMLYLGRAQDLVGRNKEAQKIYRELRECPDLEDSNIRAIASRARPYTSKRLTRMLMPYSTYIPFE